MEEEIRPQENMGLYYHQLSKGMKMGSSGLYSIGMSLWPDSWKTIEYKEYKGVLKSYQISHEIPIGEEKKLFEVIRSRNSNINFAQPSVLNLDILCKILITSCGKSSRENVFVDKNQNLVKDFYRHYPSAGGRYPLEFYVFIRDIDGIENGIYHLNLKELKLDKISNTQNFPSDFFVDSRSALGAKCLLFITSMFERNMRKYSERGYRYILQESGHVAQNICLVANATGAQTMLIGGSNDRKIEETLGIDGVTESLIYTMFLY